MNLRPFRDVVARIKGLLGVQSPANLSSTPTAGANCKATAGNKIPTGRNARAVLLRPEHGIPLGGSVISFYRLTKALPESAGSSAMPKTAKGDAPKQS